MCKCKGCGVILQNSDDKLLGYAKDIDLNLCERCFRIRNYNEYKLVDKNNQDYIEILKTINSTDDLVVLVVDLFNISKYLEEINKYINNDILLVLTKRDILPKSLYDENIKNYFKNYNLNIIDTIIISSVKNYNFDLLYSKINEYKKSKNVYVVGFTNSGKSTMINKIIYNYSDYDDVITTSYLPSTTIDSINIKINDELTLIDTPGLLDSNDIINYIDSNELKKVVPKKEIKPLTYQIKEPQILLIDNLLRIDINEKTNITLYISNNLNVTRLYKNTDKLNDLYKTELYVKSNMDIVIQGLGFMTITNDSNIIIYTKKGVNVFLRNTLI